MWMLYLKQIDSLLEEAFKCCLKNNISNFTDHMSNSYEYSKCLMKIKLKVEIADNTVSNEAYVLTCIIRLTYFPKLIRLLGLKKKCKLFQ